MDIGAERGIEVLYLTLPPVKTNSCAYKITSSRNNEVRKISEGREGFEGINTFVEIKNWFVANTVGQSIAPLSNSKSHNSGLQSGIKSPSIWLQYTWQSLIWFAGIVSQIKVENGENKVGDCVSISNASLTAVS